MLKIVNLNAYYGRIQALNSVALDVKEGEIISLVGANGAGKSTLLNSISGIVKCDGHMEFVGRDLGLLDSAARVTLGISQVPEGRQLFSELTVETNLRVGATTGSPDKVGVNLHTVYERFPVLWKKKDELAGNLSGGQQQIAAIGRALMSEPRLLLMDEPSMGLAPILVAEIWKIIEELRANGMSVLLVEQNAHLALNICDRGYVIRDGEIVLEGSANFLRNNQLVRDLYLGVG